MSYMGGNFHVSRIPKSRNESDAATPHWPSRLTIDPGHPFTFSHCENMISIAAVEEVTYRCRGSVVSSETQWPSAWDRAVPMVPNVSGVPTVSAVRPLAPFNPFSDLDIYGELSGFENSRNVEMIESFKMAEVDHRKTV